MSSWVWLTIRWFDEEHCQNYAWIDVIVHIRYWLPPTDSKTYYCFEHWNSHKKLFLNLFDWFSSSCKKSNGKCSCPKNHIYGKSHIKHVMWKVNKTTIFNRTQFDKKIKESGAIYPFMLAYQVVVMCIIVFCCWIKRKKNPKLKANCRK